MPHRLNMSLLTSKPLEHFAACTVPVVQGSPVTSALRARYFEAAMAMLW
jgi:hypothetical protein